VLVEGQEQDNGNMKIGGGRDKAAGSQLGERVERGHAHPVRNLETKKARSKRSILCHESYNLNLLAKSAFGIQCSRHVEFCEWSISSVSPSYWLFSSSTHISVWYILSIFLDEQYFLEVSI
jgi:hypothetical protein